MLTWHFLLFTFSPNYSTKCASTLVLLLLLAQPKPVENLVYLEVCSYPCSRGFGEKDLALELLLPKLFVLQVEFDGWDPELRTLEDEEPGAGLQLRPVLGIQGEPVPEKREVFVQAGGVQSTDLNQTMDVFMYWNRLDRRHTYLRRIPIRIFKTGSADKNGTDPPHS